MRRMTLCKTIVSAVPLWLGAACTEPAAQDKSPSVVALPDQYRSLLTNGSDEDPAWQESSVVLDNGSVATVFDDGAGTLCDTLTDSEGGLIALSCSGDWGVYACIEAGVEIRCSYSIPGGGSCRDVWTSDQVELLSSDCSDAGFPDDPSYDDGYDDGYGNGVGDGYYEEEITNYTEEVLEDGTVVTHYDQGGCHYDDSYAPDGSYSSHVVCDDGYDATLSYSAGDDTLSYAEFDASGFLCSSSWVASSGEVITDECGFGPINVAPVEDPEHPTDYNDDYEEVVLEDGSVQTTWSDGNCSYISIESPDSSGSFSQTCFDGYSYTASCTLTATSYDCSESDSSGYSCNTSYSLETSEVLSSDCEGGSPEDSGR